MKILIKNNSGGWFSISKAVSASERMELSPNEEILVSILSSQLSYYEQFIPLGLDIEIINPNDTTEDTLLNSFTGSLGNDNSILSNKIHNNTIVDSTLTLTKDKYQTAKIVDGTTLKLPDFNSFAQIHLFFTTTSDISITMPYGVKFQSMPTLVANKTYEFIFTYTNIALGWLFEYNEYTPRELLIARYTFDSNLANLFPVFNSGYEYFYEDKVEHNIVTRTIYSNTLPSSVSFNGQASLLSVDYLDISNLTSLKQLFFQCSNVTSIYTGNWDTSNITDMYGTFGYCSKLTSIDVSHFDTRNVTNMLGLFYENNLIKALDVSNFNTANVKNMNSMFLGCNNLTSLDVSSFDTSNVENMTGMFRYCNSLKKLDISNFDVSKVTAISQMFSNCQVLSSLNLGNCNLNKATKTENVFYRCFALNNVIMNNSDYNSVNKVISLLSERSGVSLGTLDIKGIDDISKVNISTAEGKYWSVISE